MKQPPPVMMQPAGSLIVLHAESKGVAEEGGSTKVSMETGCPPSVSEQRGQARR